MTLKELLPLIDQNREVLPASDLEWFEREIGSRLPDDYRQFLLSCSGGDVDADVRLSGRESTVASLLGLEGLDRRLLQGYDLGTGVLTPVALPVPLLPVAYTDSGDPVCLCLDQTAHGAIYLVDHDSGGLDVRRWQRDRGEIDSEFRIADSFGGFVARLMLSEHDDDDKG